MRNPEFGIEKRITAFVLHILLGLMILTGPTGKTQGQNTRAPMPDSENIENIRKKLQKLQREREALERVVKMIDVNRITHHPHRIAKGAAYLRLISEMDSLRLICHFHRLDETRPDKEANTSIDTITFPLLHRGEFWLTLPAGRWSWHISTGHSTRGKLIHFPEDTFDVAEGIALEIKFDEKIENMLKTLLTEKSSASQ